MAQNDEMLDLAHCLRKEMEYYEKANAALYPKVKLAYEAAAREYAFQAALLKETKKQRNRFRPPQLAAFYWPVYRPMFEHRDIADGA